MDIFRRHLHFDATQQCICDLLQSLTETSRLHLATAATDIYTNQNRRSFPVVRFLWLFLLMISCPVGLSLVPVANVRDTTKRN